MKRLHLFVPLAALAVLAPSAWPANEGNVKPATLALTKSELLARRFHATGRLSVVRAIGDKSSGKEEVLRDFGAGAVAEAEAYRYAAAAGGPTAAGGPVIVKRVFTHYRCPKRVDDTGPPSNTDCKPVKILYTLPADPTDPNALAQCNVRVDVDVLYLGRRARTISWVLDPPSPLAMTSGGVSKPRIRLLELALDLNNEEVRGITFSDNTEHEREREPGGGVGARPVFDSPATTADGQSVVWTRATDARRGLAKVFYYAVALQLWSDTLQDYVFCEPYDPTVANRGN